MEQDRAVKEVVDLDFERVIYLGAGPFFGLAHEAQLKILELTAGKIATMYESPVGFRHGPKSLINDQTLVLVFGSIDFVNNFISYPILFLFYLSIYHL